MRTKGKASINMFLRYVQNDTTIKQGRIETYYGYHRYVNGSHIRFVLIIQNKWPNGKLKRKTEMYIVSVTSFYQTHVITLRFGGCLWCDNEHYQCLMPFIRINAYDNWEIMIQYKNDANLKSKLKKCITVDYMGNHAQRIIHSEPELITYLQKLNIVKLL